MMQQKSDLHNFPLLHPDQWLSGQLSSVVESEGRAGIKFRCRELEWMQWQEVGLTKFTLKGSGNLTNFVLSPTNSGGVGNWEN